MKSNNIQFSICTLFLIFMLNMNGQELWKKLDGEKNTFQANKVRGFKNFPTRHLLYQLELGRMESQMNLQFKSSNEIVHLPNSEGDLEAFRITSSSNFEKELAVKFPTIKAFRGTGITNPTSFAKISMGADGFHAVIFAANGKTVYIDPYTDDNKKYIVYKTSDLKEEAKSFSCDVGENSSKQAPVSRQLTPGNDGYLRTFRLALVCSGEYAQFHLNNQGVPATASDADKKTVVLSAMNTSMTRVNGVFEKDLAVKMLLVANNDAVIFLDPNTDNITDGEPDVMIDEVQAIADAQIGTENYDIGHVFSTGGSGLAGLGVVCVVGQKARGVTGRSSPIGDPFDIDFVAHEFGHQFGATHTQNNDCNRTSSTAVEPGSASTIMGYAGICAPNVQGISDVYFHAVSIAQMQQLIAGTGNCATLVSNGNSAPIANAGVNYSIPRSTPFVLRGTATDVDTENVLTYNWEQIDTEVAEMPPLATNIVGPMFRSLPSSISPNRYFPALETVVSGANGSEWEVLPSVARALNFSLLVRDNNTDGGANSRDDMEVTIVDAYAFTVTSQNTAIIWNAGATETINWDKGTTDETPINCQSITIKLSEDGGLTFPIILAENISNDGSENIIVPNNVTTKARIMVEAADNIFYNVNAVNFEIQSTIPSFVLKNTTGDLFACNSGDQAVDYTLNLDFINGFTETVSFEATGQPTGSSVTFSPLTINEDGDVVMSVSNLDGTTAQDYTINLQGNSTSVNQNIAVKLSITASNLGTVTLVSPSNGETGIAPSEIVTWQEETNASSYIVEIASDAAFTTVVSNGEPTTNAYNATNLSGSTRYYWRVKAKNSCNEGSFSNVFSFTTATPSYCASTFTNDAGGAEHILNVTFNAINNNSNNDTVDGYQDFTAIDTEVFRNINHTISVTFDTDGFQDHCYVFIDWNQDFVFNKTNERYDLGSRVEDIATATFSVKVPLDAKLGKTRMRVLIEYDDPNTGFGEGACDADHISEYGETEDYSITVKEPVIDSKNVSLQTTSETCVDENDGIVTVNVAQSFFDYTVTLTNSSTSVTSQINGSSHVFTGLDPGLYEVCVETIQLSYTQCFEVEIVESQPISLKANAGKNSNTYSFNIERGTAPFSVFLNNKLLRTSTEKSFELELDQGGILKVKSAKDCEGVFKTTIGSVLLLQNPVADAIELLLPLGIEETKIEIIIFDINGKLVLKKMVNIEDNSMSIPFQNFEKGIYILKLPITSKAIKILK
jgi:hypothetical protein